MADSDQSPRIVPGQFFIYDLVVGADKSGNACPSLHAAFGIFTAGCAWEVFQGWRNSRWLIGASWVWTAAILASTLLIKQHVILDLLAGGLLGFVSWWFVGRTSKKIMAPENDCDSPRVSIKTPSLVRIKIMKLGLSIPGMTGAQAIVETLRLLEVDRVFGLPGVQNIELFDALADAPFSTFTPTNESAAVFMADAHARVTGKFGVAVVTAGPGLTNALTGIAEARLDSSPVLLLVGASGETGKSFQLHQIDQCAVVKSLVKGCSKPATAAEIPQMVLKAVELAIPRGTRTRGGRNCQRNADGADSSFAAETFSVASRR